MAGSGVGEPSSDPLTVPAGGLSGQTLTVAAGVAPLPSGTTVNGTSSPTVNMSSPSAASVSGCANGLAAV